MFRGVLHGVTPVALKLPGGAAAIGLGDGTRAQVQLLREVAAMQDARHSHILQYLGVCFAVCAVFVASRCCLLLLSL